MKSVRCEDGTPAEVGEPIVVDREVARRWQDAAACRFAAMGVSTRGIGLLLNLDHSNVVRRLEEMPAEARRHYATCPLEL